MIRNRIGFGTGHVSGVVMSEVSDRLASCVLMVGRDEQRVAESEDRRWADFEAFCRAHFDNVAGRYS